PQNLTQRMSGRTILVATRTGTNRKLLQHALTMPQVSDGVIQGKYVRLILKPDVDHRQILSLLNQPNAEMMEAEPRFEDAFIDLLGGGPASESALAKIMPKVEGSHDETVIEAQELTKKFGDFAATDHVNFQVKR
ncbi:ABC transporter ATP-binding protein, partial [Escherichia coli]